MSSIRDSAYHLAAKARRQQRKQKMDLQRAMKSKSFQQTFKQQSTQPPTDDEQLILATNDVVDKDIKKLTKQEDKQQKQQQEHIDHLQSIALDKVSDIQKQIRQAEATDPTKTKQQQVYEQVKRQILQKQEQKKLIPTTTQQGVEVSNYLANKQQQIEQPSNFKDLSYPLTRRNYDLLVKQIIARMSDLTQEQSSKLWERYRYRMKPGVKMQSLQQLRTRINALYGKYTSWAEGHKRVNFILSKINSQLAFMNKKPTKWYSWYLRNVLKLKQDTELWQNMVNPDIMARQMERRAESLTQKRQKILKNIHFYYRKYQNVNLTRVKQLTQLMQKKTEVYQQQKKTLTFLVDSKMNEINVLKQQIENDKAKHQEKLSLLDKKLANQKKKQIKLHDELEKLKKQKNIEQKTIKAKQQEIQSQRKVIQQQSLANEQEKRQLIALHEQNMKLKAQLLASHETAHKQLMQQQVKSHNQHIINMKQLQQHLQNVFAGQKGNAERRHTQLIQQQYENMYRVQHDLATRLQGKQVEMAQWQEKANLQFNRQKQQYESKLSKLRQQTDYSKEKQQQLLKAIQSTTKQAQNDKAVYKRLMENKVGQLAQKLSKAQQERSKTTQMYQKKIKALQQSKKSEVDQMLKQIAQLKKQKKRLQDEEAKLKQQLNKLNQIVAKYADSKDMETSILSWYNSSIFTIRQCFRQKNSQGWIASTRGVNIPRQRISSLYEVIKYWIQIYEAGPKSFPMTKQTLRLRNTDVLSILDIYKDVKYFGLRQAYWKQGEFLATRRGINVSWQQFPQFMAGIKSQTNIKQIINASQT